MLRRIPARAMEVPRALPVGLHFGKEKVIKTEVGGVHETSRKKQKQTMSINKSDPKDFFLGASFGYLEGFDFGMGSETTARSGIQTTDCRQ
jgi:hypothetical protein